MKRSMMVTTLLAAGIVAGCGGGGGTSVTTRNPGPEDLSERLANGQPVSARPETTLALAERDGEENTSFFPGPITLRRDGNVLIASLEGTEYRLTEENRTPRGWFLDLPDGESLSVQLAGRQSPQGLLNPQSEDVFANPIFFFNETSPGNNAEVVSVFGVETTEAQFENLNATATYEGGAEYRVRQRNNGSADFNRTVGGDLQMTADFDNNMVSGRISALRVLQVNEDPAAGDPFPENWQPNGQVVMEPTVLYYFGFVGDLSADSDLTADSPEEAQILTETGSYQGALYGPGATEVAGSIITNSAVGGEDYISIGGFYGNR